MLVLTVDGEVHIHYVYPRACFLAVHSTLSWCWAMAVLWYKLLLAFQLNASVIIRANVMMTEEFW